MPETDRIPVEDGQRSAISDVRSDPDREVEGMLLTWDEILTNMVIDNELQLCWATYDPHSFDEDLRSLRPELIHLDVDHESKPVGRFLALTASSAGIRCIAEVFDTPAGNLSLAAAHSGIVSGFSCHAGIRRSIDRGMRDGVRRVRILDAQLRSGSLCTDPADLKATIELVCGEEPEWQGRLHRIQVMENLRRPPALVR